MFHKTLPQSEKAARRIGEKIAHHVRVKHQLSRICASCILTAQRKKETQIIKLWERI